MTASIITIFRGFNWYDALVPVVLAYGIWDGRKAPLIEKILGVAEMALALVVGIAWYAPLAILLEFLAGVSSAAARPAMFIGIATVIRVASLIAQHLARRQLARVRLSHRTDLVGRHLAGFVWAVELMIWITIALCLTNAPFFRDQIARQSKFGAAVTKRLPAAVIMTSQCGPGSSL
ncbi:MAG TPA: hypothetical protein VMP11_08320 [Verrucomicrobiae bacterium]|nr:hypothetical protein [Verrucomicrobiae bacterium]